MTVVTIASEEARNRWGDMMDTAFTGGRVVIKRHNKPQAVLVGHADWEKLQERLRLLEGWLEARKGKEEYAAGQGEFFSWDEVKRLAEARHGVGS